MTARIVLLTTIAIMFWALAAIVVASSAEAGCRSLSQAREAGGYPRYRLREGKKCWYVHRKDAGTVSASRSQEATPTAADGKLAQDRADEPSGIMRTVKTFPVTIKPGEEVVQSEVRPVDQPGTNGETRPRLSGSESGADTAPYWWEDDRPEALLMPTLDQWSPPAPESHSTALWWAMAAAVLSIATVTGIAQTRLSRARRPLPGRTLT